MKPWILLALLLLPGCMNIDKVIDALARDNASFCGTATTWGGAGAVAIAPTAVPVVPSGGAGYASVDFCRTNAPNSMIIRDKDGTIRIAHGWGG